MLLCSAGCCWKCSTRKLCLVRTGVAADRPCPHPQPPKGCDQRMIMEHVGPLPLLLLGTFLSCPLVCRQKEKIISADIHQTCLQSSAGHISWLWSRNISCISSQQADTSQGKSWASCTLLSLRTKPSLIIHPEKPTWELQGFHDMSNCPPACTSESIHRTCTSEQLSGGHGTSNTELTVMLYQWPRAPWGNTPHGDDYATVAGIGLFSGG